MRSMIFAGWQSVIVAETDLIVRGPAWSNIN